MRNPNQKPRFVTAWTWPAAAVLSLVLFGFYRAGQQGAPQWNAPARAAKQPNPVAASSESIALGQKLYVKNCQSCHGSKGLGDGPQAKDLEQRPEAIAGDRLKNQSDGELFWKLSEGKKPMPSFEKLITAEERWHIINYIRTLNPKK